jgi:hypothetical protein
MKIFIWAYLCRALQWKHTCYSKLWAYSKRLGQGDVFKKKKSRNTSDILKPFSFATMINNKSGIKSEVKQTAAGQMTFLDILFVQGCSTFSLSLWFLKSFVIVNIRQSCVRTFPSQPAGFNYFFVGVRVDSILILTNHIFTFLFISLLANKSNTYTIQESHQI